MRHRENVECEGMILTTTKFAASDVFTPTSFPNITYVERSHLDHERKLAMWLAVSTQIASVRCSVSRELRVSLPHSQHKAVQRYARLLAEAVPPHPTS